MDSDQLLSIRSPASLEALVAATWAEVLQLADMPLDANFFDAGGRSIHAGRAVAVLGHALGRQVPVQLIFEAQTPREFARRLTLGAGALGPHRDPQESPDASPYLLPGQYPCFAEGWYKHSASFVLDAVFETDHIDIQRLRYSLERMIDRHDILRTGYVEPESSGSWTMARRDASVDDLLEVVDLDADTPDEEIVAVRRLAKELASRIDLASGRVLHVGVLRAPRRTLVLVVASHVAVDAYAYRLLVAELYDTYVNGWGLVQPDPREVPVSGIWWARRIGEYVSSDESAPERAHWLGLPRSEPLRLAVRDPGPPASTSVIETVLSAAESAALDLVGQRMGVSLNEMLVGLVSLAARPYVPDGNLAVSSFSHGRDVHMDGRSAAGTIAWLGYPVPHVLRLTGEAPTALIPDIARQMRELPRGGVASMMLAYRDDDEVGDRLRTIRANIQLNINCYASIQSAPEAPRRWRELETALERPVDPTPRYRRIRIRCERVADAYVISWAFNPNYYDPTEITGMARDLSAHLHGILALAQ